MSKNAHKSKHYSKSQIPSAPPPPPTYKHTCNICNVSFTTSYRLDDYCVVCLPISNFRSAVADKVMGKKVTNYSQVMPAASEFYTDYKVRIEFKVASTDHSGYCSDHDDTCVRRDSFTKTITCKLYKSFKNRDFDPDTNEITNTDLLNKLYLERRAHNCHCRDGDITFSIIGATIFKKADIITLDD